jgi:hypothetical protein
LALGFSLTHVLRKRAAIRRDDFIRVAHLLGPSGIILANNVVLINKILKAA